MSLIEQAAQRLEQLRQAGVDMPPQSADVVAEAAIDEQALPSRTEDVYKRQSDSSLVRILFYYPRRPSQLPVSRFLRSMAASTS